MIQLTRLSGAPFVLNADLIERVDRTPDTVITLADGKKILVRETASEVATRFHYYQRSLHVDTRFGGRRAYDPPTDHDPARYEHPARARLRAYEPTKE